MLAPVFASWLALTLAVDHPARTSPTQLEYGGALHPLYPAVTRDCPDLPSPLVAPDGREYVVVRLHDGSHGLVDDIPSGTALTVDEIAARSGRDVSAAAVELLELELAGEVLRLPDGRYSRVRGVLQGNGTAEHG